MYRRHAQLGQMLQCRAGFAKALLEGLRVDGPPDLRERGARYAARRVAIHALESSHRLGTREPGALEGDVIREIRAAIPAIQQDRRLATDRIDDRAVRRESRAGRY